MTFHEKLLEAYQYFFKLSPLYFHFLKSIHFAADHGQSCILRNDVRDGYISIYFSPSRCEALTAEDLSLQLEHQLIHLILSHSQRRDFRHPELYHLATDFVVNHQIERVRDNYDYIMNEKNEHFLKDAPLLPMLFDDDDFAENFADAAHPNHVKVDRVYEFLQKNPSKWLKACEPTDDLSFQLTDEQKAMVRSVLGRVVHEVGDKGWGVSPGLQQYLQRNVSRSRRNYAKILEKFIGQLRAEPQRSWARVHRRHPNQAPGKKSGRKPLVCAIIDTSGSMWSEEIFTEITRELLALKSSAQKIHVVVGDTELKKAFVFDRAITARDLVYEGGGGTDLQFGWDHAREMKCDSVICYTDGCFPEFNDHGIPSFFMLTMKNNEFVRGGKFARYQSLQIMDVYA